MPSSQFYQLNDIVEAIVFIEPRSILDVGVGFGKYGVLAREYLEAGSPRDKWIRRIDGIEGFAAYMSPLHKFIYDHLYTGDARHILPQLDTHYDLALLIDAIEHFEFQEGRNFLSGLQQQATNLLVSTPRKFAVQEAVFGNELEIHRSQWRPEHFQAFGPCCFIPSELALICLIGPAAPQMHSRFHSWRRVLKRQMPWLASFYRICKRVWARRADA